MNDREKYPRLYNITHWFDSLYHTCYFTYRVDISIIKPTSVRPWMHFIPCHDHHPSPYTIINTFDYNRERYMFSSLAGTGIGNMYVWGINYHAVKKVALWARIDIDIADRQHTARGMGPPRYTWGSQTRLAIQLSALFLCMLHCVYTCTDPGSYLLAKASSDSTCTHVETHH